MATVTQKTTKLSNHPCGFCSSDHHDKCPGGVLNGDGVTVVVCDCTAHPKVLRCLDCGLRTLMDGDGPVNPETWTCFDIEACQHTREKHRREINERLFGAAMDLQQARTAPKAPSAPKTPRKAAGTCLHCGEPTKGGLFLPGHDSAFLSETVKEIKMGASLDDTLTAWHRAGISEALQNKLTKRVSA